MGAPSKDWLRCPWRQAAAVESARGSVAAKTCQSTRGRRNGKRPAVGGLVMGTDPAHARSPGAGSEGTAGMWDGGVNLRRSARVFKVWG